MLIAILILWLLDILLPSLIVPGFVYGVMLICTLILWLLTIYFSGKDSA